MNGAQPTLSRRCPGALGQGHLGAKGMWTLERKFRLPMPTRAPLGCDHLKV